MSSSLINAVLHALESRGGSVPVIKSTSALGGGCINRAMRVELVDGRKFFVKSNEVELLAMFEAERVGLD